MDKIAGWSEKDRAELFQEAANRKGMNVAVIEKDFWVCWILGKLFAAKIIKDKIMFKGGTSLSKVFNLIERFSEDIDLILHQDELDVEDIFADRLKSKQRKLLKQASEQTKQYLKDDFLPEVEALCQGVCSARINTNNPMIIDVGYPASFSVNYLRPEVTLEIGPRSSWEPNKEYEITPYTAEEFPGVFDVPKCQVKAITAERTFWEKITILHHEAHRVVGANQPLRISRHYYDVMQIAQSQYKESAFKDLDLLRDVVCLSDKFFPRKWAKDDLCKPGTMKLVPPEYVQQSLRKDYNDMQIMIFGKAPTFEEIMASIRILEQEINELQD